MHLKRSKMPGFWPIPRKEDVWAVRTGRGPHSSENSIPLGVALRDILKVTSSLNEAKTILNEGKIFVNGIVRKDYRYPIGQMDVLDVPDTKDTYRVVPSSGGFRFEETKNKAVLSKIVNKTALKGGKTQYTTHNGFTLIAENKYKIGDTLELGQDKKISGHHPLAPGSNAMVTGGRLRGSEGKIREIGTRVKLDTKDGSVETVKNYIFVVGGKS